VAVKSISGCLTSSLPDCWNHWSWSYPRPLRDLISRRLMNFHLSENYLVSWPRRREAKIAPSPSSETGTPLAAATGGLAAQGRRAGSGQQRQPNYGLTTLRIRLIAKVESNLTNILKKSAPASVKGSRADYLEAKAGPACRYRSRILARFFASFSQRMPEVHSNAVMQGLHSARLHIAAPHPVRTIDRTIGTAFFRGEWSSQVDQAGSILNRHKTRFLRQCKPGFCAPREPPSAFACGAERDSNPRAPSVK